jgi:hypothetical protein
MSALTFSTFSVLAGDGVTSIALNEYTDPNHSNRVGPVVMVIMPDGTSMPQGHGVAASALRVELSTDGTGVIAGVTTVTTVSAVTAITNALPGGTNSIGQVTANAGTNLNTSALAVEAGGHLASIDGKFAAGHGTAAGAVRVELPTDGTGVILAKMRDGAGTGLTSLAVGAQQALTIAVVDASGNQITSFGGGGGSSVSDPAATTGAITIADSGTASVVNSLGQTIISGTPTAGSFVTIPLSGESTARISLTAHTGSLANGTYTFEKSYDSGAHYLATSLTGPSITGTVASAAFTGVASTQVFTASVAGVTNLRIRCTAFTAGQLDVVGQPGYGVLEISMPGSLPAGAAKIGNVGIDQTTPGTTNLVQVGGSLPAGTSVIGVTTAIIATPTASTMTRPANTTAYAVGALVANSVTAGSVVPLSFTAARIAAGNFAVRTALLKKSGSIITNAAFRLHLFSASPTIATTGDAGVFATVVSGSATYLGYFDILFMQAFADGAIGSGAPWVGNEIDVALASGQTVYGLLEARGAYTPASAETFTASLQVWQN